MRCINTKLEGSKNWKYMPCTTLMYKTNYLFGVTKREVIKIDGLLIFLIDYDWEI